MWKGSMTQPKLNAGQRGEVDASCSIVPANVSPWFMCTNYFPLYKVLMSTLLPIYIQICFLLYVFAKTKSAIISLRHDDVKMKWFWSRLLKQNEKNGYSDTRLCPEISIQTSWHCYEFTPPPDKHNILADCDSFFISYRTKLYPSQTTCDALFRDFRTASRFMFLILSLISFDLVWFLLHLVDLLWIRELTIMPATTSDIVNNTRVKWFSNHILVDLFLSIH